MPVTLSLTVNGKKVSADVDSRTLLVDYLRNDLGLTGTHVGCDTGQCGACTVHLDGNAVKACTILAAQANGADGADDRRPCRGRRHDAPDAGGVQGMPRPAMRILHAGNGDERDRPRRTAIRSASEQTIREELEGNFCRCTGYHNIVKAVQQGAAAMGKRGACMGANEPSVIGASIRRKEDYRFLTGSGQFTDDVNPPNHVHAYFLRSPHAHAKIRKIDTAKAKAAPGVVAIFTGRRSRRRQRPALRLAHHGHRRQADERAAASGAGARQGPLRRRPGRARHRGNPEPGEGRRRADRRRLRSAAVRSSTASMR